MSRVFVSAQRIAPPPRMVVATALVLAVCSAWSQQPESVPDADSTLTSAPHTSQTVKQPAGTTFTFSAPGDFRGGFSQPYLFLENGLTAANIHAMQGATAAHPNAGSIVDVVTCGQLVPVGATTGQANCYSAFQRAFAAISPVGFYSREEPAVDGITEWGANLNLSDRDDVAGITHKGTTEFAQELDVNVTSPTTAGAALFFGSIFLAQPANMGAIHLPLPNLYSGNQWSYGFIIDDGAVRGPGIHLGTTSPSPKLSPVFGRVSAPSQPFEMVWRDASAQDHTSTFHVDQRGTYHLDSDQGAELDRGDFTIHSGALVTPALTVSRGVGGGAGMQHLRVPLGCSTAAATGATCTSAPAVWAKAFADTSYTLVCTLEDVTGVPAVSSVAKTRSGFTVTAVALTPASATGTANCMAMHDLDTAAPNETRPQ
jgi:hypothetical protein